jgi:hypothetical protein
LICDVDAPHFVHDRVDGRVALYRVVVPDLDVDIGAHDGFVPVQPRCPDGCRQHETKAKKNSHERGQEGNGRPDRRSRPQVWHHCEHAN